MMSGVMVCCYSLGEIRTRMKLVEVSTIAAIVVFLIAAATHMIKLPPSSQMVFEFSDKFWMVVKPAGYAAAITLAVGVAIQAFLPVIERIFKIATSMTLMEYSDANQPLLRKMAMEAPGTFSHSLLIGHGRAAAEGRWLTCRPCRVYYHDIGKLTPDYFV
jgi:membrane-associated HD superfamily phosphohydrolase